MAETKKVKVKKFSFKRLLVLILFLYLICSAIYYFFKIPIKSIYVKGNNVVSDTQIINAGGLQDYPPIFKAVGPNVKKKINDIDMIKDVKIRIDLHGKLTISISEYKVLFYDIIKKKIILEDNIEIDDNNDIKSIPTLVNEVPSKIYEKLTKALLKVDNDTLALISEIEYSPSSNNGETIDNTRFLLRMNDGNTVYINLLNIKNLNHYIEIYSTLNEQKGFLYLDSSNEENFYFKRYE